jgi:predicted amidohydrolase
MKVVDSAEENLKKAGQMIGEAARKGADLVVLPEMFICPYEHQAFKREAQPEGGEVFRALAKRADEASVYLVAGSVPERDGDEIYNTSYVFDSHGHLIGKHRKVHLFDIDVPGKIQFFESDTLAPGDGITVVDTVFGKIGVAICFDIRFSEMFRAMAVEGAHVIVVPAAFNETTGPVHWELTYRMRAVDQQVFMVGCAPALNEESSYRSWGHSLIVNPWGEIVGGLKREEGLVIETLQLRQVGEIRGRLPIMKEYLGH